MEGCSLSEMYNLWDKGQIDHLINVYSDEVQKDFANEIAEVEVVKPEEDYNENESAAAINEATYTMCEQVRLKMARRLEIAINSNKKNPKEGGVTV